MSLRLSVLLLSLSLPGAVMLSGCSGSFDPATNPIASEQTQQTPIGSISGSVHGGQAPVTGAQIYLFAAGTAGYNAPSTPRSATSLIKSTGANVSCTSNNPGVPSGDCYVTTDGNGNFSLSGDYTCTPGTQVYMVASGGNPGLSSGTNNTAIMQMAGLGQCPTTGNLATQVPNLVINEVTTVAFAYAMGGFGTNAFNISSNAANSTASATAIANAMANAGNIANVGWTPGYGWGAALPNASGNTNSVAPQLKINALANAVAMCVNSANCSSFLPYGGSSASPATDEATAIFYIVHNPTLNVSAIFGLPNGTTVFTPALTTTPTDWTMPVTYSGVLHASSPSSAPIAPASGNGPFNIAFDANGNAWMGDPSNNRVVEIGPQGALADFPNSNFGLVQGVAVSPIPNANTIWVTDYNKNTVDVISNVLGTTGTATILSPITGDLHGPLLTAFSGNVSGKSQAYEVNESTAGIVAFDSAAYSENDYETGGNLANITTPAWISVDNSGNPWIPSANASVYYVGEVTVKEHGNSGNFVYSSAETGAPISAYSAVTDLNSNIWLTDTTGTYLEEVKSGTSLTMPGAGGGLTKGYKLAVDGNNNIWIANSGSNTVTAYSTTTASWLGGTSGFSTSAASGVVSVVAAPDLSGNLWVANSDGSVTQLLGLATPTAAPLYGGVTSSGSNSSKGNIGMEP